jgi:hypothetical protein
MAIFGRRPALVMPGEPPVKIAAPRQGLSALVPVYKKGGGGGARWAEISYVGQPAR